MKLILDSCCDLSDAALLVQTRRSQATCATLDLYISPTVVPVESSSLKRLVFQASLEKPSQWAGMGNAISSFKRQ